MLKTRKLKTIQTKQNLNTIIAVDEKSDNGSNYNYQIFDKETEKHMYADINFQKGPRNSEGSSDGVLITDLLEIVRDSLINFQNGPLQCEYNEIALKHVTAALESLNKRIEDRVNRNVFQSNNK